MPYQPKEFAGRHCGCRYQQDYRPTLGRDGKRSPAPWRWSSFVMMAASALSSTVWRGAATFVFGVWAEGMDPDGTLHWALPDRRKKLLR